MPSHLSMEAFVASCRQPLRRSIRVNTLKITVSEFVARMAPLGWQLDPVPWCETGFWLTRSDESVPLATRPSICAASSIFRKRAPCCR